MNYEHSNCTKQLVTINPQKDPDFSREDEWGKQALKNNLYHRLLFCRTHKRQGGKKVYRTTERCINEKQDSIVCS